MLNRSNIFTQLQSLVTSSQPTKSAIGIIADAWQVFIATQTTLRPLIAGRQWHFPVPLWFESPDAAHPVSLNTEPYGIIGVDGSQIYPDRFYSNLDFFVINTGGIAITYQHPASTASFFSQPYVYTLRDALKRYGHEVAESKDLIDLIREEYEFKDGLQAAEEFLHANTNLPFLCLFDGSFIFWHLESKQTEVRDLFLSTYMRYLRRFQELRIPIASYISAPRNRELCNALRFVLCERFASTQHFCLIDQVCSCKVLQDIIDVDLITQFIKPGQRTGIFMSKSSIADHYFDELKPCFFFLNVGEEIARIELPWWMAKDPKQVTFVASIALDQAHKGIGYPVVLAEAHEQAVIKHQDKNFFYELLSTLHNNVGSNSPMLAAKNMRKRRMLV